MRFANTRINPYAPAKFSVSWIAAGAPPQSGRGGEIIAEGENFKVPLPRFQTKSGTVRPLQYTTARYSVSWTAAEAPPQTQFASGGWDYRSSIGGGKGVAGYSDHNPESALYTIGKYHYSAAIAKTANFLCLRSVTFF